MGVHVRTQLFQCLKPSLTMDRGMPKFWPIALLSVLNSKYKIREQMELERDRVSFLSPSKHGFVDNISGRTPLILVFHRSRTIRQR